jgi:L-galactose dehydrogenase
MEYRDFGRTGLKVSLLSFGTGGPSSIGNSDKLQQAEEDAIVRRCLDLGVNLFDSSPNYGRSEAILGHALEGVSRDSYYLATKWPHWDEKRKVVKDDPQELLDSVEESLRRMRTDYVDILQFHGLLSEHYDEVADRFMPVMEKLKEQGKIRFNGFSIRFHADPKHEAAKLALSKDTVIWDSIMLKYGILNQWAAKEILPLAIEKGVGILNMAAVRFKLPNPQLLEETIADWKQRGLVPADSMREKNPLDWLIHDDVDSVISAGYKFAADHPGIPTVLTGTINVHHLDSNARALENPHLSEADTRRVIELFGNIGEYA